MVHTGYNVPSNLLLYVAEFVIRVHFFNLLNFKMYLSFQNDILMWKTNQQHLLVQDGKLYGRDSVFAVICKASLLPEVAKNHDIQKNETVVQLGQVSMSLLKGDFLCPEFLIKIYLQFFLCLLVLVRCRTDLFWVFLSPNWLGFCFDQIPFA